MRDTKLSSVLHMLLHMAQSKRPLTSDELAGYLETNPVVVRRELAGLRDLGYVHAGKGLGGGWLLARDPASLTLGDVYKAVGAPTVIAMGHRTEHPDCQVEQAVNAALQDTFAQAQALIEQRLASITVADLIADFERRRAAHPPVSGHQNLHMHAD